MSEEQQDQGGETSEVQKTVLMEPGDIGRGSGDGKKRHGCLTAWLVLVIIVNALTSLIYVFANEIITEAMPGTPGWMLPLQALLGILSVVCAVGVLQLKRWGFTGFCAVAVITIAVNVAAGVGFGQALVGLVGIAILYGVLQIGGDRKGWSQLD